MQTFYSPKNSFSFSLIVLILFLNNISAQEVGTYYEDAPVGFESINWSPNGVIYTVDYYEGKVYKLIPGGTLTQVATGFTNVAGGGFDADGNYYFSDIAAGRIYRVNADDSYDLVASGFNQPVGIAAHPDSNFIYVVSYGDSSVKKVDLPDGTVRNFVAGGGLSGPDGLALAPNGDLIVANFNNNRLFRISPQGSIQEFARHPGSGFLGYVTKAGDYYYAPSLGGHTLARFSESGTTEIIAGTGIPGLVNGAATQAQFNSPNGIAVNPAGDTLLIAEDGRIRFVTKLDDFISSNDEVKKNNLTTVFPSPFSDQLTVEYFGKGNTPLAITLFDIEGRLIQEVEIGKSFPGTHSYQLQLPGLPSGMYLIQIKEGVEVSNILKVWKE